MRFPLAYLKYGALRRAMLLVLMLALGLVSFSSFADETYTVRKGDSLYSVARKYGITVAALAERNKLTKNSPLYAGKELVIPRSRSKSSSAAAKKPAPRTTTVTMPSNVQKAIDKARVRPGRWKHIVIHHSAVQIGSPKSMDRYHREVRHMENGLAYHFVIGNGNGMRDGEISVGRRWTQQLDGGHLASESQNRVALGICLVGNFDVRKPTTKQMESLRLLTRALMKRCALPASTVRAHREINIVGTRCPGKRFDERAFRNSL